MIDESWQETLINWRCLGKFCFLFWALFARLPPCPPQFSFFLAQNHNVIPISCSKTVCLFHKTDMGGRDYYIILWQAFNKHLLESIFIIVLSSSVSLTKQRSSWLANFQQKFKLEKAFTEQIVLATICFSLLISQL